MPELPEVETVRRTLENFILNKKIEDIKILYPKIGIAGRALGLCFIKVCFYTYPQN